MRAAYVTRLGGPEEIVVGELPDPVPGPDDVLVDIGVSTVNAVDTFVRSGRWATDVPFPFVVGRDLVGTVADPGRSTFRTGETVWCNSLGHDGRQGAAAERAAVGSSRLYRLPPGVDPGDAVTVLHPGATAFLGLVTHGGLRAGETVAVIGAAGNVGAAAVLLAADAGARVVAVASARDADHCRELGAADVLDHRDPDLAARVRDAAPSGIDLCLDAAGRNDLPAWLPLLAHRGRFVVLAGLDTRPVLPAGELYTMDRSVSGFVISRATVDELAAAAGRITPLIASGRLRSRHVERVPLDRIAEEHRRRETGEIPGGTRVVVQISAQS